MSVVCRGFEFGGGTSFEGPYTFSKLNASRITPGWNCSISGCFSDYDDNLILSDVKFCVLPGKNNIIAVGYLHGYYVLYMSLSILSSKKPSSCNLNLCNCTNYYSRIDDINNYWFWCYKIFKDSCLVHYYQCISEALYSPDFRSGHCHFTNEQSVSAKWHKLFHVRIFDN